jgi:RimJ/RimL family protein N-acetyltransferase
VGLFGISLGQAYRGLGLSQPLAQMAIDQTKKTLPHIRMVFLKCFATNTPAMKMYAKVGFKEVGRVPGMLLHQGEYIDEVQMVLPLSADK